MQREDNDTVPEFPQSITAADSALLLVEMQRQWTDPGPYHLLIRRALAERQVLSWAETATTTFRRAGGTVIHAPLVIDPLRPKGALAFLTLGQAFRRGKRRAELTPGTYAAGDLIVSGRYAFDAFKGSTLEQQLRDAGVRHLFVGGFITDQCVLQTVQHARRLGFDVWLVAELTATFSRAAQRGAEKRPGNRVVTCATLLQRMEQQLPASQFARSSLRGKRQHPRWRSS